MKLKQILVSFCAGALTATLVLGMAVCKQSAEYKALKAGYLDFKKVVAADKKLSDEREKEQLAVIEKQNKKIADILAGAGQPTQAEKDKDKEIAKLKEKWTSLSAECQDQLRALDTAWSKKFTLAEERHGKAIFDLNAEWQKKYDARGVISDKWKKDYNDEHALRLKCEGLVGAAEKRVSLGKFWITVETAALVGLAGFAGYKLLKGK